MGGSQRLDILDFAGGRERELDHRFALFQAQALRLAREAGLAHHGSEV